MAFTMQQIVDLARVPLNDSRKVRYSDASLLAYANSAIQRAYALRPDLQFGTGYGAFTALALGGTFPLPDRYAQAVANYTGGMAELKDDEASAAGRGQALLSMFAAELK